MLLKSLYKVKSELVVPFLIVSYATYYYLEVAALSGGQVNLLLVGPVYYLIILSAVLYVFVTVRNSYRTLRAQSTSPAPIHDDANATGQLAQQETLLNGKFIIFAISTLAYVLLFDRLGFVTSSFLYLAILMYLLGMKSMRVVVLVPAMVVAVLYVSMVILMRFPLPSGWLI